MATTKIAPGETLTLVAPSGGVVSGTAYKIGDVVAVATVAAAPGALVAFALDGVWSLPKAASITPNPGVKLYWDDTNKVVTNSASGNTLIGVHADSVVAVAGAARILVRLNGAF